MTESLEFEWVLRPDSHPGIEHYVLHFRGEARAWDDDAGEEDHSAPYQEKPSNCKHDREKCDDACDVEGLFPPRDGLHVDEFDMDPALRRFLSIFFPLFIQGESMVVLHILFGHASGLFMDFRVV